MASAGDIGAGGLLEATIDDPGGDANLVRHGVGPMSLMKWAIVGLLALPAAEFAALVLVALAIGWIWTIALFLATSVVGILLLRRSGKRNVDRFLGALSREGVRAIHLETPGLAAVVGGILLVFPGFITDLAGALLFVPAARRWAGTRIGRAIQRRRRDPHGRTVIDLPPDQWRQLPEGKLDDKGAHDRPS